MKSICGNTGQGKGQQGFTLIEVMAAAVILGLAYVAVLQNFSLSARNIVKLEEKRGLIFAELLAFEEQMIAGGDEEKADDGAVFMEGKKYRLVERYSESGELGTLTLEKL